MSEAEAPAVSEKMLGKRKKEDKEFQPEDAKDNEETLEEEEKLEQGDTKVRRQSGKASCGPSRLPAKIHCSPACVA